MDWEFGVGRCNLLFLEWIGNEVLLHSQGNCIQSLGLEHGGRWYEKKMCIYMCMCVTRSLCCTGEIGTALQINYTLIKIKEKIKIFLKCRF